MLHYVAEQMALAEKSKGEAKATAEARCFEAILKLWEYRYCYPKGLNPTKNFAKLAEVISRLDPTNPQPRYFNSSHDADEGDTEGSGSESLKAVKRWAEAALGVDRAARVLVELCLQHASTSALDDSAKAWLERATGISDDTEFGLLNQVGIRFSESRRADLLRDQRELEQRIEYLDWMVDLSGKVRDAMIAEVGHIKSVLDEMKSPNDTADTELTDRKDGL